MGKGGKATKEVHAPYLMAATGMGSNHNAREVTPEEKAQVEGDEESLLKSQDDDEIVESCNECLAELEVSLEMFLTPPCLSVLRPRPPPAQVLTAPIPPPCIYTNLTLPIKFLTLQSKNKSYKTSFNLKPDFDGVDFDEVTSDSESDSQTMKNTSR